MQVKTQQDDLQNYLTDASNMPGGHAERLFVPERPEEVAEILREANAEGTPVTISVCEPARSAVRSRSEVS